MKKGRGVQTNVLLALLIDGEKRVGLDREFGRARFDVPAQIVEPAVLDGFPVEEAAGIGLEDAFVPMQRSSRSSEEFVDVGSVLRVVVEPCHDIHEHLVVGCHIGSDDTHEAPPCMEPLKQIEIHAGEDSGYIF